MFTGIVTDVGRIMGVSHNGDTRMRIACAYDAAGIDIGASIACAGVCLTVVDRAPEDGGAWFDVDVSAETLARTTLGAWAPGARVNLERALKVGDELGGHVVTGHVDGVAEVVSTTDQGGSVRTVLRAPRDLSRYIATKGSVTLNGTSLTVNEVDGVEFGVNLIPHTRQVTTWGEVAVGDHVNLEIDVLARYVARLAETA